MEVQLLNKNYLNEIKDYLGDYQIDLPSIDCALQLSKSQLDKLNCWLTSHDELDPCCEINFFKTIKSVPFSHFIYFLLIKDFLKDVPVMDTKAQNKFLRAHMDRVNAFYRHNSEFISYILQEQSYMDPLYFTREATRNQATYSLYFLDPGFSTSHDTLLAKFKAFSLFKDYLENQSLDNQKQTRISTLRWTGQKVDLVELVYALHSCGVFNHGNASLKKIAEYLQCEFGCDLGDFYRSYSEIRFRKKSRTKFLDQLAITLQSKMELDDQ
ncbi:RteC domain-containing protein [Robiginitalea sp. M366]|uniref:RteC domain-containing protein n=1 Tax=Robiginitalea aestuariiviva TaxID=3036903 RepID=UPI00240DF5AB|nr:RteC domain-containing protein [Robiginitalea aestuariiviva]MDG1573308.1 RteC domain-containing protein [Robiginitalea aestuariiviva]